MSNHGPEKIYHGFIGSYLGLLFGWIGLLAIAGGIILGLREVKIIHATWTTMIYWGKIVLGTTACIYALAMFVMTFVFSRRIEVHALPSVAFAIWGAIPVGNIVPVVLLLVIAGIRSGSLSTSPETAAPIPPAPVSEGQNTASV